MKQGLLEAARRRLAKTGKRTRHVDIRRAISDGYYAMFHALAEISADELIGAKHRSTDAWLRVYRALDHKPAKNALQRAAKSHGAEEQLQTFAATFSSMQELRHEADYDPRPPQFNRADALARVDEAEEAVRLLGELDSVRLRAIATELLFKERTS